MQLPRARHAEPRARARKTHAKARCIGRECAERCLQGRRPAAPPPSCTRCMRSEAAQKMPEPRALSLAALRAAVASLKAPTIAWSAAVCAPGIGARSSRIGARSLPADRGEERAWLGALVGTHGATHPWLAEGQRSYHRRSASRASGSRNRRSCTPGQRPARSQSACPEST